MLTSCSIVSLLATGSINMTAIPLAPKPVILVITGRLNHNLKKNHVVLVKSQTFETGVVEEDAYEAA